MDRSRPMAVKYWTRAGLLWTYRCPARCACCYVCASPGAGGDMAVDDALAWWEGLLLASPHGCRIHVGGGEPFLRYDELVDLLRRARAEFGENSAATPPEQPFVTEAVETNGYWADDAASVRERLVELDRLGMGRLNISADPFHQQFVPPRRVRLLARLAEEVLGAERVRVRWRDWLEEGQDVSRLTETARRRLFAIYVRQGRERLNGRAAVELAGLLPLRPWQDYADNPCAGPLLRGRHVHIDHAGRLCPGTCAGIVLGQATDGESIGRLWRELSESRTRDDRRTLLDILAVCGPAALAAKAVRHGFSPDPAGYAGKCHLCWQARRWLFENGYFADKLGPEMLYNP